MKLSLFKIGIILVIAGSLWIGTIFVETEKVYDEMMLQQSTSFEMDIQFVGSDIGFYKIFMPNFDGEQVFVQILDNNDNVINENTIHTKMSVGYFDYLQDGQYSIKLTNISKNPIHTHVEFGDTNSKEMIPAGVLILLGAIILIVMSYLKIKNYNMEHPDENIS